MKKLSSFILAAVLIIALGLGILSALKQPLDAGAAKGHLLWDAKDGVWRCVGSPSDCSFEN